MLGVETAREEPFTPADADDVYGEMVDFLATAGVPPPPRAVRWVLDLPKGLTKDEFWTEVQESVDATWDACTTVASAPSVGPTPLAPLLEATEAALARLYSRS